MPDDLSANTSTLGRIAGAGDYGSDWFDVSDSDWFAVDLVAGQIISIKETSFPYGALALYDANGVIVANGGAGPALPNNTPYLVYEAPTSGTYYVAASSVPGLGIYHFPFDYTFSVAIAIDDHPANTISALSGGVLSFSSDYIGDVDSFSIHLNAGQTFGLAAPMAANNFDNITFSASTSGGFFVQDGVRYYSVTAQTDGDYVIRVGGSVSQHHDLNYSVFTDDYSDDVGSENIEPFGHLSISGSTTGALQFPGDADVFVLHLPADTPVMIQLVSGDGTPLQMLTSGASGAISDQTTVLYNSHAGEDVSVRVDGVVTPGTSPGYTVLVTPLTDDLPPGAYGHLVGNTFSGQFEFVNETDTFTFSGQAGDVVRLEDLSISGYGRFGATLYDPNGVEVDPGFASTRDEVLLFQLPQSGTYTLDVSGYTSTLSPYHYQIYYSLLPHWDIPTAFASRLPANYLAWSPLPDPGPAPTGSTSLTIMVGPASGDAFLGPFVYTVQSGETVWTNDHADSAFISTGAFHSRLVNHGTIWVQDDTYHAIAVGTGNGWGTIFNDGEIVAFASGTGAVAIALNGGTLNNQGDVFAIATGLSSNAQAYQTYNIQDAFTTPESISNAGRIVAWSAEYFAQAIYLGNEQTFDNSGLIYAAGFGSVGALGLGLGGTVTNSGQIVAISGGPVVEDFVLGPIVFDHAPVGIGNDLGLLTLDNTGTIEAQIAVFSTGVLRMTNSGQVYGDIVAVTDSDAVGNEIHNSGLITGDIYFGDEPDVFDGSLGQQLGQVLLGGGNDNAIGGDGNDYFLGEAGDDVLSGGGGGGDTLSGGSGNDILNGGTGADTMSGGVGDDVYYVDNLSDVITENSGEGIDVALVSVSGYTLGANVEVAAIQGVGLTLTGNSLSNILYGASGADTLNGGDGDDTLQGGANSDTLVGGLGNDTFYVAQPGDTVVENSGEGFDATIVQMTTAYTLAANVEVGATFLGLGVNITGNGLDNLLYGNAGADTLNGAGGNDFIQGAGGNDAMIGGTGNDTYFIEDAGDAITESANEGIDAAIVFTSSYTLAANVEVGARFLTTAYTLTGNALDNQLYGNNGDDTLNGGDGNDTIQGGGGNDTMVGGLGNDTYLVEQAGDVVIENANEGSDAVIVLMGSYTLAANVEVGATFLTTGVSITGNGLDNRLYGNSGADTLSGAAGADLLDGGAGADALTGGSENDVFMFIAGQANGDSITDFAGNGAATGDVMRFSGYGTTAGGATFVQLDATHWQINSADGTIHDTITLANGASVDASDWLFV